MIRKTKSDVELALAKIDKISNLMDVAFVIPGTKIRFGWDSIMGLIPAIGDFVCLFPLIHHLAFAYKFKLGKKVYLLLIANQLIDFLVGSIPLVGDVLDVVLKANKRNAALLRKHVTAAAKDSTHL
ncbi:DUF4112 domain-containing protein [Puniceicoccaceae bacterium K14]|nr:DUF4112 domain-containing protein [Puniceicoccaceae bacterium K14]